MNFCIFCLDIIQGDDNVGPTVVVGPANLLYLTTLSFFRLKKTFWLEQDLRYLVATNTALSGKCLDVFIKNIQWFHVLQTLSLAFLVVPPAGQSFLMKYHHVQDSWGPHFVDTFIFPLMNPDESSKNLHEGSNILKTMLLICKCQDAEVPKMVNIVNNIPG